MIKKSQRTIESYEKAGSLMRLLKAVGSSAACELSKVLYAADTDKFLKALSVIDVICSKAEDNMFADHPELSNEYLAVFYGAFTDEVRNETDLRIVEKAREASDELFKGK